MSVYMGQNVSFVVREELAEWLESRAKSQMKSVSSVCQDIVAREFHREQKESAEEWVEGVLEDAPKKDQQEDPLNRWPDDWYEPDGEHDYTVIHPRTGERWYYKTSRGARSRLLRIHGEKD